MKAIKKGGSAGAQQQREDHSKAADKERLSLIWTAGRGPAHMNDPLSQKKIKSATFFFLNDAVEVKWGREDLL